MKKWLFFAALVLTACAQKADLELAKDLGNSEMIHHPALWTCDGAAKQFLIVDQHTLKANGLNHHGWDESRLMAWSNPETGCSAETWGRAEGWCGMKTEPCR